MVELLRALPPDEEAVRDERGAWTFAALDARVNALVHVLRDQGLGRGGRLALVAANSPDVFAVLLACLHAGVEVVPVNAGLTARELGGVLGPLEPRVVVVDGAIAGRVRDGLCGTPAEAAAILHLGEGADRGTGLDQLVDAAPGAEPGGQCSGGLLPLTSGSQGAPRAVVNGTFTVGAPLGRVADTALRTAALFGFPGRGRALVAGPWYHAAQLFFSLFPLLRGMGLVLHRRFDAAGVLAEIDRSRIRLCHLAPTHFVRLLRLGRDARAGFGGASLERVWHGGGPCPVAVKEAMLDWWGPVLYEYYGATEAGVLTTIAPERWRERPGSVGRAVAGTDLLVVDGAGRSLPPGAVGTVYARREPARDFRYLGDDAATERAHLGPGVFTYGDQGRVDADGFLYLTGRGGDRIVTGGVNVSATEVSAILLAHPAVRDAVVVGRPDEEFGEVVTAVIEAERAWRHRELATVLGRHCREHLAGYKVPRRFEIVEALPREESGKLRRASLERAGASPGGSVVVIDREVSFTRDALDDLVARLATVLGRRGAGEGSRVVWTMPNRNEVLLVALACKRLGAVLVPVSYRCTRPELERLVAAASPAAAVCDASTADGVRRAGATVVVDVDDLALREEWGASEPAAPPPPGRPDRLGAGSSLVFTSGTTGVPKGVLRTAGDPRLSRTIADAFGFGPGVRYVASGPLYHSGPGTCAFLALAMGGVVGLPGRFRAADWLAFVRRERMNATFITPTQLRAVVGEIERGAIAPDTLRHVIVSGESFPAELKERASAALGECLTDVYGSTELGPLTMMPSARLLEKPTSCGRPFAGVEVKAFDSRGALGPGAVGELRASTGMAFDGYFTGERVQGRSGAWVGVGDLGFVDADGDVHVVGRSDDVIITGGVNVYPADVEEVLLRHPAVRHCAVIGLPDDEWGQVVTAAVVSEEDLDLGALRAWMRGRIADDKRPRRLVVLGSLPLTQTDKLSRRATRELLANPASEGE